MLVCPYYPPHIGGAENYVYNIAKGLSQTHDWKVIVITSNRQDKRLQTTLEGGITVYRLPSLFTFSNTPINPFWYFQIRKIIQQEHPDLINAHTPVPFIADIAALANQKIPFIVTYHCGSTIKQNSVWNIPIFIYEKLLLKYTLNYTKMIICVSDYVRNGFLRNYKDMTITINPGVDNVGKYQEKSFDNKTILFVASLTKSQRHKGFKYLLQALVAVKKRVKNAKLFVVGDGDAVLEYKKLAKTLGLEHNVVFTGPLFGEKLNNMFRRAHILVLPSLSESFGMVLIEAMAQGTPVIGTAIGGIPDIVTHGKEGLIVPPYNSQALADAITTILENSALAETMGKAGFEKVKNNYLWDTKVKTTKAVFERFL